ncbi:isoleucine--tRNA ligase [Corynebacterium pseudotuberculosis]|uniref:Isoleucine--tRNA ligase n=1 Tax=Corynebacterium pseudotuberculosis (strain C231) TaxID=681645 RepID=D9QBC6_CORP2|nr:isoleucine--tRNA ligase [Corynebacterium pseudotuberculosis]ADL10852.1 isoleucine--tRNA ligase [Corynebacterium pseudotuberculosis C231]ADO26651.1 isoleucine--tRNA ligase [Corynebacterium pseudotuberculosis I19]AEK92713.1 Isoleucyl-tRNA synthetase [Corynebacterium pseudotuberculosis PAT10]AEP70621.1 Isoleucyl-tRNA synthetase [Corynebacterium pseudotuberculosis 42/02-A]AFF22538.1 Isoleucyl-tRNA synthetase [Corynebacterium pseudotuberculosis P54B96]
MTNQVGGVYPKVDMSGGSQRFPDMEQEVLNFWSADNTFQASLEGRADSPEYVFYDGPPFANGLPHYGHLLTGYVKDIVPRYQTMKGKLVGRVFGWDCHGLPAELEAEKQLGIKDKGEIESMGLEAFNDYCAKSVLEYTQEWKDYVTRQARWVDFDNGYKTMDLDFMESVMWAFKELYDKGLIYQGFRVLPYSWAEHTPLSNQETRLDDSYKMRQDPTLTVTFPVTGVTEGASADTSLVGAYALAWTTTPWTLPSNLALAVNPGVNYAEVKVGEDGAEAIRGQRVLLAEALVGAYAKELGEQHEVLSVHPGVDLVGLKYQPIFDYFADTENAFQVLAADYVTTEDGTGIVHQAPAFGEDDMNTCKSNGIPTVIPVDMDGKFTSLVPEYEGLLVFDANKNIIADLKAAARVVRHQTIEHSYPHSWRSGEPLIYMALPSWFVEVTKIRDRMVELNKDIEWMPAHIRDGQFGKWLEGARDWNISRNRYWGSPIPVWVSDDENYPRMDVYGSLDELERDFGVRPTSLHRPFIDELTRPNPDDPTGKSMMRRVPEVLDCWFESGSMPFAQKHYPFENKEWFDSHSPADFIVEYSGQTRGWFYTLHVLATALFDRPAFKKVVAHGIVLGDDGTKMSKSRQNYPNVNEVFNRDGSDAMRWFLMSSPILRGGNLIVTEQGIREGVRQALLPMWNAYSFLQLYSSKPAEWSVDSIDVLDKYILAKLHDVVRGVGEALDNTDIAQACDEVRWFCDALTNWYVRRSRERFWAGDDQHPEAFNTLFTVLETLTRVTAPLLPMVSEVIWRGLTGERSVHMADFPNAEDFPADADLVRAMDEIRGVCSATSSVRKAHKLRNRLPLPQVTVALPDSQRLEPFTSIIRDEVNVKNVVLTSDVDAVGRFDVVVNAKVAGPRLGKDVQRAIKAVKSGNYERSGDVVVADGIELKPDEFTERLVAADPDSTAQIDGVDGLVVLDMTVDESLEAEGWAADVIRGLQDARKASNFEVSDRIVAELFVPEGKKAWADRHSTLIAGEVLATTFTVTVGGEGAHKVIEGVTADVTKA